MNKVVPFLLMISLLLTACAGHSPEESKVKISSEQSAGRATSSLLAKADIQEQSQQWERAAALLERALRIEPRNAYLWHRLARIRMLQGQHNLAINLVQKSEALAGDDEDLKEQNTRLRERLRSLTLEAPL